MKNLHIDIETYSEVSIADCGAYKYALDDSFRILLIAYAIDDEPTEIIDCESAARPMPDWLVRAILDPKVIKHAHNASFERICFSVELRRRGLLRQDEWLDPLSWECSMIKAARCGLPLSLKQVGSALELDEQKMDEGKALIQLFCCPKKRDKGLYDDGGSRVLPCEAPEKWELFKSYCVRDVDVERAIDKELSWYEVSDREKELYATDQRINDRGVRIDLKLAGCAVKMSSQICARLAAEAVRLTGLANPNSPTQLKQWLSSQLGVEVTALNKSGLPDLARMAEEKPYVKRVLELRSELAKTSNAKYSTMLEVACKDGRARGVTQFYGTRTGRWSGRLIQMQNLPQNHIDSLSSARQMLKEGDIDSLDLCYGDVQSTLSQLIRTAFIPSDGKIFAICDFSAIEARVLAWVAAEEWVLDTFRQGGDIYCATATQMFHVPVRKHGENAHLRQRGKVAVLALGYQGGVGALEAMGGSKLGMTEEEERETVDKWREANGNIVKLWGAVENAAATCITYGVHCEFTSKYCRLDFDMQGNGTMTITLPSGRMICYPKAEVSRSWRATGRVNTPIIDDEQAAFKVYRKDGIGRIRFKGMNQTTKKWEWIETYGGKLTENIVQAIARDCLAETMLRCESGGFPVVFHIHDELVMEVDSKEQLERIEQIFSTVPEWAEGLPLNGAGYIGNYYYKD